MKTKVKYNGHFLLRLADPAPCPKIRNPFIIKFEKIDSHNGVVRYSILQLALCRHQISKNDKLDPTAMIRIVWACCLLINSLHATVSCGSYNFVT